MIRPTVVLGAGLAGLAAAHAIARRGGDVCVLEASDRVGGVIQSAWQRGVLVESGAQSLRGNSSAWRWVEELGLAERVLRGSAEAGRRYLFHRGRLVALPSSPLGLLRSPLLSAAGRLRLLAEPFVPGRPIAGESVFDLLARRIGAEAADAFGTPFVGGIFGGDPRQVEAESALGRIAGWERDHGSLLRGALRSPKPSRSPGGLFSFPHGIGELTGALGKSLAARVRTGVTVEGVAEVGAAWRVQTSNGSFDAANLVVALPPTVAARLLPGIPTPGFAPVAAVLLAWPKPAVEAPDGFGWLVHPAQSTDALGAIHVSAVFPAHAPDRVAIRVMLGGTRAPALAALSDDALVAQAGRVVAAVSHVTAEPSHAFVGRVLPGIPQYPLGFAARVRAFARPGLALAGWGWSGPGVPDQLDAAEALADRL